MATDKVLQVADTLYHSIQISWLEKCALSTEVFNRLHNILQNSTVFLTYPCNRTSRLSHSLGCMHLAGQILRHGLVNASTVDRQRFLNGVLAQVRTLGGTGAFKADIAHAFPRDAGLAETLANPGCGDLDEPAYRAAVPGLLPSDGQRYGFLVALQSLRLAALLHDLGHPPFSHVTEFALNEINDDLTSRKERGEPLTERQTAFLTITGQSKEKGGALHERIGKQLTMHVLDQVKEASLKRSASRDFRLFAIVVKHITLALMAKESPELTAMYEIVSSPLDADRLDYVRRDLMMSGLEVGSLDYERLFNSYRLKYFPKGKQGGKNAETRPLFLPSSQALSSIEAFFRARLNLYKYVLYHHRVAKTDGLMKAAVMALASEYLGSKEKEKPLDPDLIPDEISGLWRILDPQTHLTPLDYVNHYIQWDDSWLLSLLRKAYFSLVKEKSEGTLRVQLEEILSNAKRYHSLYKRVDTFLEVDETFARAIPNDFLEWPRLKPPALESAALAHKNLLAYRQAFSTQGLEKEFRNRFGFFIVALQRYLNAIGQNVAFQQEAARRLAGEDSVLDVILMPKLLKPGIPVDLPVLRGNEVCYLEEVTALAEHLATEAGFFPPFYVYLLVTESPLYDGFAAVRRKFGETLAEEFARQYRA